MTGCSADYCTNNNKKGFIMCKFPLATKRRKVWIEKVNRTDWVPGPGASLCEIHFAEDMWEKVATGKRLKRSAIPTLFDAARNEGLKTISLVEYNNHVKLSNDNRKQEENMNNISLSEEQPNVEDLNLDSEWLNKKNQLSDDQIKSVKESTEQFSVDFSDDNRKPEENVNDILSEQEQIIENSEVGIPNIDNKLPNNKNRLLNYQKKCGIKSDEKYPGDGDRTKSLKMVQDRLNRLEKMFVKSEHSRVQLKKTNDALRKKILKLEKQVCTNNIKASISKLFNKDQIDLLSNYYKKIPFWCNATIIKALKLRFTCGTAGYEELLRQKFPLPCIRTLSKKLENLKLSSGINEDIFQFLKIKVSHFVNSIDRDCMLVLDEISIKPGRFYDASTNNFIGNVTLPGHNNTDIATHGLVFMLAGLGARWKQAVALYYTSDSVNGLEFRPICEEIIQRAENIGLRIHAVTSDMGAANQAMWKAFSINASRYSKIRNSCVHPIDSNRQLYFYADTPHAFKNAKAAFISHEYFTIPDKFVEKYKLPNNKIQSSCLNDIIVEDENNDLKLTPKLRKEYLEPNNHFLKMRVSASTRVINEDVASALEFLTNNNRNDERLTTAWFINFFSRWFSLMSSRRISMALSEAKQEKFADTIAFLKECIDFFTNVRIGKNNAWKPFQTAILISTKTVIELSKSLLNNYGFTFFMASRLTQDCLENLFSVVRLKNVTPNALQLKNNLKLIIISQYMKTVSNSNYDQDDREYLGEFLDILLKNRCSTTHYVNHEVMNVQLPDLSQQTINFLKTDLNVIYYIAGYLMSSIKNNQKVCSNCLNAVVSNNTICHSFTELTRIRSRKTKRLFVNETAFNFFLQMEAIFRLYYKYVRDANINLKKYFLMKFYEIPFNIPDCHELKKKIIHRYYSFRMKICSKASLQNTKTSHTYASKTMAMHEKIK